MRSSRRTLAILGILLAASPIPAIADRAHDLAAQAASQGPANCSSGMTLADCHPGDPTGCSKAQHPTYDAYLNFLKNQAPSRDLPVDRALELPNLVDLEDAIPTELKTRHHADHADALANLGEGNIHSVVGFLYFVEDTAVSSSHRGETCNCQLKMNKAFDFHLGIGFD